MFDEIEERTNKNNIFMTLPMDNKGTLVMVDHIFLIYPKHYDKITVIVL